MLRRKLSSRAGVPGSPAIAIARATYPSRSSGDEFLAGPPREATMR